MNLKEMQKEVLQNKINKGFNTTDINKEFCLLYGEVSEAYDAYRKNKDDLGEELADIAIYLLGISEILGKNLEEEIINKIENISDVFKSTFSIYLNWSGRVLPNFFQTLFLFIGKCDRFPFLIHLKTNIGHIFAANLQTERDESRCLPPSPHLSRRTGCRARAGARSGAHEVPLPLYLHLRHAEK
mgnify:CR=1 FL=1